jgi:hypothetical protein
MDVKKYFRALPLGGWASRKMCLSVGLGCFLEGNRDDAPVRRLFWAGMARTGRSKSRDRLGDVTHFCQAVGLSDITGSAEIELPDT